MREKSVLINKIVGNRLRDARTQVGLTQIDCAKALGINSAASYCYYEKGKRRIPLEYLVLLSKILNKPLDYFLLGIRGKEYDREDSIYNRLKAKPSIDYHMTQLNSDYLFSTYLKDSSNSHAYMLARSIIESDLNYIHSLYIYSQYSIGKTHILHSIGNAALEKNLRVMNTNGLCLSNEITRFQKETNIQYLLDQLLAFDLLIIDNINFLGSDNNTQSVFCTIIDEFHDSGKTIVMSGRQHPELMDSFDEITINKLISGPVARLDMPRISTWERILKLKSIEMGWCMPDNIAKIIVKELNVNGHSIKGIAQHYIALKKNYSKIPNIDIAEHLLEYEYNQKRKLPEAINPREVLVKVSEYFGISSPNLISKKKNRKTAFARQIATYLLREDCNLSFTQIGSLLGNRDHSTIIYSWKKINNQIGAGNGVSDKVLEIRSLIYAS